MNNRHLEAKEHKTSHTNAEESIHRKWEIDDSIIAKNPKIDAKRLSDFYQSSDGVIQRGKGANYNLSHPLGSNVVPNPNGRKKSLN